MDKWLFIEVQTYQSVNNMGRELAQYVYDKYDQTVVHKDCIPDIQADIIRKMGELQEKYPRCKPFGHDTRKYEDRRHETVYDIYVGSYNPRSDNFVFILRTKCITKMNLETSLHF